MEVAGNQVTLRKLFIDGIHKPLLEVDSFGGCLYFPMGSSDKHRPAKESAFGKSWGHVVVVGFSRRDKSTWYTNLLEFKLNIYIKVPAVAAARPKSMFAELKSVFSSISIE
jgi:hypothetical protein